MCSTGARTVNFRPEKLKNTKRGLKVKGQCQIHQNLITSRGAITQIRAKLNQFLTSSVLPFGGRHTLTHTRRQKQNLLRQHAPLARRVINIGYKLQKNMKSYVEYV